MAELTQEHFDQKLNSLVTNDSLKIALQEQTTQLKSYTDEQTEKLASIVADSLEDIHKQLDMREEVQALKKDMVRIKQALHLS
jgi:hypothetical protein